MITAINAFFYMATLILVDGMGYKVRQSALALAPE
jgi:hypothetical protein